MKRSDGKTAAPVVTFPPREQDNAGAKKCGGRGMTGQRPMKTDTLAYNGLCHGAATSVRHPFPSRSCFISGSADASRTCVAVLPRSLLISGRLVNSQPGLARGNHAGRLHGECACRVNGILIMFPLACSIRAGGRHGRSSDGCAEFSQGWGLIAGPQTPVRQAESTGAKE